MRTEKEIKDHYENLSKMLDDALENPESQYDANDIQVAMSELRWVLEG